MTETPFRLKKNPLNKRQLNGDVTGGSLTMRSANGHVTIQRQSNLIIQ